MSETAHRHAGFSLRPLAFDILLALFVFSAFIGTQTTYAPGPAWAKFWLIVGAWGLYYAVVLQPNIEHLYAVLAIGGIFGLAVTVGFFLTTDWSAVADKVPTLTELGRSISAQLPTTTTRRINPNVIGGILAMLLPLYVPLVLLSRHESPVRLPGMLRRVLPVLWPVVAGIVLLGVLVTTSRGAWVATLVGFALWGLWAWLGQRVTPQARLKWVSGLLLTSGVLAVVAVYVILTYALPGAGALTNRLTLLKSSLPLVRDYVLTGAGLGSFQMNFSIYTLLIHVGYIINGHNVFVDLLVEQGMIGLGLYLCLVVLCIVQGVRVLFHASWYQSRIIEAGLVSLVVILIHSQVEDVVYGSQWLFLYFVPFAFVRWAVKRIEVRAVSPLHRVSRGGLVALGLLFVVGIAFWRPLLAQGYASQGAMYQARVELAHYEFGQAPGFVIDSVRQEQDLGASMALFERAIALDPGNATARQRLGGIYLSRGEYDLALRHLESAWGAGHRDSVTRLLLGDALVANGRVDEAAQMISGLPWAAFRLDGQAWSRYREHDDFVRTAYTWRTIALVQPERAEEALQRAAEAESRTTQQP